MYSTKIEPKYNSGTKPKVGLIALATDFIIEKDFIDVTKDMDIDLFVNRIHTYFPLTSENLIKMSNTLTEVSKDILPDEKLDCVAYGCTSGTIAAGYTSILEKVNLAKPNTKVTTPITSAISAIKTLKIKKLSVFTPYTDEINQSVINYLKKEDVNISDLFYFNIASDIDIGKIDPEHLFDVLSKQDLSKSEALFVSCTALPVLSIIKDLEKKLGKIVLSSNQTLIWDTLNKIDYKNKIEGYGELFNN